jgi:hypothetical protein
MDRLSRNAQQSTNEHILRFDGWIFPRRGH